MAERVLCDQGLRVAIDGGGDRTLLVVTDGITVRYWIGTDVLEGVLRGDPVQLSSHEGYCAAEVDGDLATMSFGLEAHGTKRCVFPAADLRDALAWVRSLGSPHEPGSGPIE